MCGDKDTSVMTGRMYMLQVGVGGDSEVDLSGIKTHIRCAPTCYGPAARWAAVKGELGTDIGKSYVVRRARFDFTVHSLRES